MFTMGATLSYQDFGRMIRQPTPIAIGVLLQFVLMPMIAWLIVRIFHLPDYLAVGIILVACSPGGTASNIICYLSRGDVALSISLTTCSTLLATLLTPMLTFVYIGQTIDVPVFPMIMNIAQVVILPVFAGVCINALMPKQLSRFRHTMSLSAIITVCLIIASAISAVHDEFNSLGPILILAVILLNLLGYATSYLIASILRFNSKIARTIAIEVAMQNSGLAVVLALQHFNAIASLPGA
jgi:bile acid:Na+ symporter, BASS family